MNASVFRQIRDIQNQAAKLLDEKPSLEDLEEFSRYNEEMKLYLVKNLEQDEIVEHVLSIPNVIEVEEEAIGIPIYALMILTLLTVGLSYLYIKHVEESRRISLMQDRVRDVQAKYATLEFLLKAAG